jgi:glycosyltransferase involved in cell wall biosynthesis
MHISIITVTYNSALTLKDTIESVQNQGYRNVEHIFVDGLSKDDTLQIVKSYPHISLCISEKDQGIYDAMNKGINLATGDVIGILNSDDFYTDSQVLEKVARVFRETGCDAIYGDLQYVDVANTSHVVRMWKSGNYQPNAFKWGWMPPHPTFFVRKELYEKFGNFNLDMNTAADYELMLRFIHKHGIRLAYIPEVLVKMRIGGASNNSLFSRFAANKKDKQAWVSNGLKPFWFTLYLKPLRKIHQYLLRTR